MISNLDSSFAAAPPARHPASAGRCVRPLWQGAAGRLLCIAAGAALRWRLAFGRTAHQLAWFSCAASCSVRLVGVLGVGVVDACALGVQGGSVLLVSASRGFAVLASATRWTEVVVKSGFRGGLRWFLEKTKPTTEDCEG